MPLTHKFSHETGAAPFQSSIRKVWEVEASLPVSFVVKYSTRIFEKSNPDLLEYGDSARRFICIDKTVYDLYKDKLHDYFDHSGLTSYHLCVLESTEERKDWDNLNMLLSEMEEFGLMRRAEPIIAIGGGVLLDIVGFAASIYRRGVPYIRVPTTLLGIVDASVGAKTAINHFERRNRLGTYYPPIAAYLDKTFVVTQDEREICNGLAEIFKLALIKDTELFRLLEENAEDLIGEKFQYGAVPVRVINRAITGMVEELAPNLWEKKLDRCVDFGHSFSPLIEMMSLPELLHGEAVCLDCLFSSCIAMNRGLISEDELKRIFDTAKRLNLPTEHRMFNEPDRLDEALTDTSRHRNGNQYLPLPCGIGSYVFCNDLINDEIVAATKTMLKYGA